MASGSFNSGATGGCRLYLNWWSSAGTGGSTVSASLVCQNQNGWYYYAGVDSYGITIHGNGKAGSSRAYLSSQTNGSATILSHSVWVGYTGNASISISGYANFGSAGISGLGNQSAGGTAALDKVGSAPTMGSCTAPSTGTWSETTKSITVSWNAGSSYSGTGTYRVDVSINGGSYTYISGDLSWSTHQYTYNISNPVQGTKYQFRISCGNDVGWSSHVYSGTVTLNTLNAPTIGTIPSPFNPYVSTSFTVNLSGGSQTNGGSFMRRADVYMSDSSGNQKKWYCGYPSYGNTSITLTISAADIINTLGVSRYSATITAIAWIENSNGSRSGYVQKSTTVNINSDGGATPTLGSPTLSGGAFGYSSTCFLSYINNIGVTSATASLRRAPSGTTVGYTISCTGKSNIGGSSATFSSLSEGVKTITVTATDSRGLSASASVQARVQAYSAPTIKDLLIERIESTPTSAKITYGLYYTPIYAYSAGVNTQGTQLNGINSQAYSKDGSTWVNTSTGSTITDLNEELVYNIQFRIADKVRTTTYIYGTYKVPTVNVGVSIRKWGIGIGLVPQSTNALEVKGNGKLTGTLLTEGTITSDSGLISNNGLTVKVGDDTLISTGTSTSSIAFGQQSSNNGTMEVNMPLILNSSSTIATGGMNGQTLISHGTANINAAYGAYRSDTGVGCSFGVGSGGTNHGLWSQKLNKWIIHGDASNIYIEGNKVLYSDEQIKAGNTPILVVV